MAEAARKHKTFTPRGGGNRSMHVIPVMVEKTEDGYMAYNDDLQVCAAGATPTEAFENWQAALEEHISEFGDDVLARFARR